MSYTYGVNLKELPSQFDCIRPPRDKNPNYPLPPKFDLLSELEQRWWRVNACCIQETPQDFVESYGYFFTTYLWHKQAGFLKDRRQPPAFHYKMVHDVAAYHFNAFAAPRHACKSFIIRIIFLLCLLTRRNYGMGYLGSKQEKYRECLNSIRKQLRANQRIKDDFGIAQGKRGNETFNSEIIELAPPFNTSLRGLSIKGGERGFHGEMLLIDDPERDPTTDEAIPELVEKFTDLLEAVFIPMVEIAPEDLHNPEISRVGRTISYFGTIIGESMMLNKIITAEPGGGFDYWNRWKFEKFSMGQYLWPERWGSQSIEISRGVMGNKAFDSEMQNRPGKSQVGLLHIDPLFHTYDIDDTDTFLNNPLKSNSLIRWAVSDGGKGHVWKCLRAFEWLSTMTIGILMDPHKIQSADKQKSQTSDYTAIHIVGNDYNSNLWSLDLYEGRCNQDEAIAELFKMVWKWWPTFIAMEMCGIYGRICDEIYMKLKDQLLSTIGWTPYAWDLGPFNNRTESKPLRIMRTKFRFDMHAIRFPWWRRNTLPYSNCFYQVNNFTEDMTKLKNDDIIDTIGLTPYVFRGPGGRPIKANNWEGHTVEQLIEAGRFITPGGSHIIDMLPSLGDLSETALAAVERFYHGHPTKAAKRLDYEPRKIRTIRV